MNSSLSSLRDPALERRVAALYDPALPYHNFDHVEDTLAAAELIIEHCRGENIRIDPQVIYLGLLLHDAGYHEDHRALGFATKEAYSAALAERVLPDFGIGRARIDKVVGTILATERDAHFVSADQKVVRAADLSGMAAPWPEFLDKSCRLRREVELLSGRPMSWRRWQENSREVLGFYLGQEIRLTGYFYNENGESAFHAAVRDNLGRLLASDDPDAA